MTNPRNTPVLVGVAAVALLFGATGGAVAGGVVTGKQIKNASVTGKDIRNRSLGTADLSAAALAALRGANGANGSPGVAGTPGTPGVSGYVRVADFEQLPAGTPATMDLDCPGAKKLVGAAGFWESASDAVQVLYKDDNTASVFTAGVPTADALFIQIVCVTATGARPAPDGGGKAP